MDDLRVDSFVCWYNIIQQLTPYLYRGHEIEYILPHVRCMQGCSWLIAYIYSECTVIFETTCLNWFSNPATAWWLASCSVNRNNLVKSTKDLRLQKIRLCFYIIWGLDIITSWWLLCITLPTGSEAKMARWPRGYRGNLCSNIITRAAN